VQPSTHPSPKEPRGQGNHQDQVAPIRYIREEFPITIPHVIVLQYSILLSYPTILRRRTLESKLRSLIFNCWSGHKPQQSKRRIIVSSDIPLLKEEGCLRPSIVRKGADGVVSRGPYLNVFSALP
jgi:hypothetical protein